MMDTSQADVEAALVRRTITKVRWFDESPQAEWTHHETCWLWLDDGIVVQFSSWGHDADGVTFDTIEVRDVEKCDHCGESHPDSRVFTLEAYQVKDDQSHDVGTHYTYCTNGNSYAWFENA